MSKADMSSQAVTARLKRVAQLRRLGLSLKKARIIETRPVAKRNQSTASDRQQSK